MANKEALRELQTRLANRLQAARTRPRQRGWLAVECAGAGLLLPLAQSGEIFPLRSLLKLPHAKPWLTGVAQLRGDLYTVVDLAAFLGLRAPQAIDVAAPAPLSPARSEDRGAPPRGADAVPRGRGLTDAGQLVMLAPALQVNAALRVDRLAGLRGEEQLARLDDAADNTPRPAFAAGRWQDVQGATWQELDLAALAVDGAFLDVMV